MKAYDIYKGAVALMFEKPGQDKSFEEMFPQLLSSLLGEALPYENSTRLLRGKEKLTSAPIITSLEDEVDYSEEICRVALPFGVCAYFFQDDGESSSSLMYRERFVNALSDAARCSFEDISDVYGGNEI